MAVPTQVAKLVQQFKEESQAVKSSHFKEAWVRRDYIDPFFGALGWDVAYEHRGPQMFREVIFEDTLRVEGAIKAPDYSFRTRVATKFFVEAKKPSVNLWDGRAAAFQVRRYAWTASLPLSILTDFEELAIYDCRVRPQKEDKASTARSLYMSYEEYPDRWDEIASLFSKEAVLSGSLDAFAQDTKKKKGVATVDQEFLKDMERWREMLAKDLAQRNPSLTRRELNYSVQMTIDRIVFLRICEDRGIEDYGNLEVLQDKDNVYDDLRNTFRDADDKYNSGLFHFQEEKGRDESPDDLTLNLQLADQPLKKIIKGLYYPESPYQFSVMPVEILGQVYEQFLGKVISITPDHQAVVEEKPEVRKAGGVYYTPSYIVEYIVKNTVGKLLEGKTPRQVSKLKILDPACGSGSFLIGAYSYLLEWHREWYVDNGPEKNAKVLYEGSGGEWQLTSAKKKDILLNNIYGVDLDSQAVEVTKLSLLLKVLEGETNETINSQLTFFQERALPDLDNNIRVGNSLIGEDFYATAEMSLLDEEERHRIHPFNWEAEFFEIMERGGFDAVIGNPPYVRIHNLVDFYPQEVRYIQERFNTAHYGKVDIYVPFIEKCSTLLSKRGRLGFILPNRFTHADYGVGLRRLLADNGLLLEIVNFVCAQVFQATIYTCLLFVSGTPGKSFVGSFNTRNQSPTEFLSQGSREQQPISKLSDSPWSLTYSWESAVLSKIESCGQPLPNLAEHIITGVKTGANSIFTFRLIDKLGALVRVRPEGKDFDVELESALLHPYSKSESLNRYSHAPGNRLLLYPYELEGKKTKLMQEQVLKRLYPKTWEYLESNRNLLEQRQKGKLKGPNWYGLSFASSLLMFASTNIVTPTLATANSFCIHEGISYFPQGAGGGCGIVLKPNHSAYYVLGVLNSSLLTFYAQRISPCFQGGYFTYEPNYLKRMPIREIDFGDSTDKVHHEQVVRLVEQMLKLHEQLSKARTANDKNFLQRQINATDRQINSLVYELYGLTEEEIKIVEG